MLKNELIIDAIKYITELFRDNSDGHDTDHSLRVYRNAMKIAEGENDPDIRVVALASLLHDADDHKLFDTKDNENARRFLKEHEIADDTVEQICEVINCVSFSKNRGIAPKTLEGKIVQDADRLDALGAIGIARTYAYGGSHGRSIDMSNQHFYDKLLLLKDEMNTKTGKEMALKRHRFIEDFIMEFKEETGSIDISK